MQSKRGRPATGRTTKQVRVPKHLESSVRNYIKDVQAEYLEPLPHNVSSRLVWCMLENIQFDISTLKEKLKEWTSRNVARLGLSCTHRMIKSFYGSRLADTLIHIPNQKQSIWQVLQIPIDAKPEEIKRAYKNMCFQWHPDVNSDPAATEAIKWVNKAWSDFQLSKNSVE